MLSEALETLQKTAVNAAGAKNAVHVIDPLPGRPHAYATVDASGNITEHPKDPRPRCHELGSVSEVPEFVAYATTERSADPVIWLSNSAVHVILDDGVQSYRDSEAICRLQFTAEVQHLLAAQAYDQKQMLRLFRNLLWNALGDNAEALVKLFRAMTFTSSTAGHGNIDSGRASYGADIASEIKAEAGDLKQFERITLNVRIFEDPALKSRRPVLCVLDDNPQEKTFSITPLGDSLREAIDDELERVRTIVSDADCPIFLGTP